MYIMAKRIIFTFLLIIIGAGSFYIGFKPFGLLAVWQNQFDKTEEEIEIDAEVEPKSKNWIDIQGLLTDKSQQIMGVWSSVKSVRDAVNTLQSADARAVFVAVDPLEALAPFDKSLGRISGLLLFMYGFLIFEKTLLAVSVAVIFMILIPICALITVSIIWNKRNQYKVHSIVIVSVLICFVMLLALPISFGLPAILEGKVLQPNIEGIVFSIDESEKKAVSMDTELRGLRRIGITIVNYVSSAKEICGDVIRDTVHYFIIFLMIYILLPVLSLFGLYKITRYSSKLILAK